MLKKVSADTVSDLTTTFGFAAGSAGAPPTAKQLIDKIRADFTLQVDSLSKLISQSKKSVPAGGKTPPTAFEIAYPQAVKRLQDFEKMVANVPKGFRLEPVLYSKIKFTQNEQTYKEYTSQVRGPFLRFLANNHADELRALGISERGISQMKQGRDPVDKDGRRYSMNVDHIIERSGGGQLSLQREVDPQMPSGSTATLMVNHFNNLILLPKQVHEFKNALNDVQKAAQAVPGTSKWVLMMVPEAGPACSGFVAVPQDPQHALHGLILRDQEKMIKKIDRAEDTIELVRKTLKAFCEDPIVAVILQNIADDNPGTDSKSLSRDFNAAVAKYSSQKEILEDYLKPGLDHVRWHLKDAFESAARGGKNSKDYKAFLRVYHRENLDDLRETVAHFPLEQAEWLHESLKKMDVALQGSFNQQSHKPANDDFKIIGIEDAYPEKKKQPKKNQRHKKTPKKGHHRRR